ncbi:hypothetical protein KIK84_10835 [Curvibacter sp. CHRR-16]|uniref:hypothetical protein n=1 Tax=Curvibacter sp. CHRR-16 TaxID=2835872 RepID=UPI001BDA07CF|nr:hypothetical protein [Curvibacter sp. CHRR-16]MBT0570826.1 hypothetical protein [Curvibacter sp. CHRR-16]
MLIGLNLVPNLGEIKPVCQSRMSILSMQAGPRGVRLAPVDGFSPLPNTRRNRCLRILKNRHASAQLSKPQLAVQAFFAGHRVEDDFLWPRGLLVPITLIS